MLKFKGFVKDDQRSVIHGGEHALYKTSKITKLKEEENLPKAPFNEKNDAEIKKNIKY